MARMRARNSNGVEINGVHFYRQSDESRIREAMLRASERGVLWEQVKEVLNDSADEHSADETILRLDGLKPLPSDAYAEIDEPASPSLEQKRDAWKRLNQSFQD